MGERFVIAAGRESLLSANGLDSLDAAFALRPADDLSKVGLEGWRQRLRVRLKSPDGQTVTAYLKRFRRPPLRRQYGRWVQGRLATSTAGVEWGNCEALRRAGIPAAEGIAFGDEMVGPLERRSFVLLAEVAGESLEKWLPRAAAEGAGVLADPTRRRGLLRELAGFVGRFHAAGFVHRDLYLSHIFITWDAQGQASSGPRARFRLIDLQRVFRPGCRRRRWVVKDLAALAFSTPSDSVSPRERLRFLCWYARVCPGLGTPRELAGSIARKTVRIARHHARRAERLASSPRGRRGGLNSGS